MTTFFGQIKGRLRPPRKRRGRQRLRSHLSVEAFFQALNNAGVRFVVLRWFETLPLVAAGEDLDLLVADNDVEFVRQQLIYSDEQTGTPCDLYSVSGATGADFRGVPYYPAELAERVLKRSVPHPSGARVPCPEDHFYSLAYHALYHKGYRSGLALDASASPKCADPEHDYAATLRSLAGTLGISLSDFTLESLDRQLTRNGWRPQPDLLSKLGEKNEFCAELAAAVVASWPKRDGLAVFVLRDAARASDFAELTILVEQAGFEVLAFEVLDAEQRERVARQTRGGNWAKGPWKCSGGQPSALIVVHDIFPCPPVGELARQHPHADNERVFLTKFKLRDRFNQGRSAASRCNVVHSSDNARQAAHYLAVALPAQLGVLLDTAARRLSSIEQHDEMVLRSLTRHGRRAKVELVRRGGQLVVRKTFRPGAKEHFSTEVAALRALSKIDPLGVIPRLIAVDELSFVLPYFAQLQAEPHHGVDRLSVARRAFQAARGFQQHGYVFLDFGPHNVLVMRSGDIKLIDLEFVFYHADYAALDFEQSPTVLGPQAARHGEKIPFAGDRGFDWYARYWRSVTQLPLGSLLGESEWQQRARRLAPQTKTLLRRGRRRAKGYLRTAKARFF